VETYSRILFQEFGNGFGLVGGEVVQNDMDLFVAWSSLDDLRHECQEIFAGVTSCCLAVYVACLYIQCRI
jgi:hypothetical protein